MFNIISSENPQNENKFTVKNINERYDIKRREYFWTVFSFLMDYISKEFDLNLI